MGQQLDADLSHLHVTHNNGNNTKDSWHLAKCIDSHVSGSFVMNVYIISHKVQSQTINSISILILRFWVFVIH